MTDHAHTPASAPGTASPGLFGDRRRRRAIRWGAVVLTLGAVLIAVFAPQAAGTNGLILLAGIAGTGLLLLYALAAGESAAKWLDPDVRGAIERDQSAHAALAAFEALSDPALIVERSGAAREANPAYRQLAVEAGVASVSDRPPSLDRVLGGHPGLAAAVFRLAKAASRGVAKRERLPSAPFGTSGEIRSFDVDVAPMKGGAALWRVREIVASQERSGAISAESDDLLEHAPIGFFSANADGKILYMNATLREWLGVSSGALRVRDILASDPARVLGRGRRPGGGPVRADVVLKAREGIETPAVIVSAWPENSEHPASRSIVYASTGSGAPVGVAQALAPSAAGDVVSTLDAMFVNAPFGVARLDGPDPAVAVIIDANPALLDMTDGAAAPGTRIDDMFEFDDPDVRARFEAGEADSAAPLELMLKSGFAHYTTPAQRLRATEGLYARVYFAPDRGGKKSAYVLDATSQKKLERELLQSQKMEAIGALTANVAHDFNNMLTAIRLNVGDLLTSHPLGDPSYQGLRDINDAAAGSAGLVRQLMAFARQQTIQPVVLDLSATMSDFAVMLGQVLETTVKLEMSHGRDLPLVKVDKGQLQQAIINLANNARDAMKVNGGGTLSIATSRTTHEGLIDSPVRDYVEGDYALIEVSDTGAGMDEETLTRIFEPFFTTKEQGKGTGLGLSTVFGIVKQSGGHVLVDSTPGKGTTFRIYLPAHDATAEEQEHVVREAAPVERALSDRSGRGRILLVEDEDAVRRVTAMTLKKRGYDIIQAADGEEALELLKADPGGFDLMVTDVVMPIMDGPTLFEEGREYLGDARVVFMSGYAEEEFAETLARETIVSFLPKPFTIEQLADRVKQEISR